MRRKVFLAIQLAFTAAVLWFAGGRIVDQWQAAKSAGFGFHVRWSLVGLSGVVVMVAYALLIWTWRYMVLSWDPGSRLSASDAARIWFVSNLGRYIPGKVWQIGAMALMAEQVGVSRVAAAGSSLVINIINLVAGVGVVAVTGANLLGSPAVIIAVALCVALGIIVAPSVLPRLIRMVGSFSGRTLEVPILPRRPVWIAGAACVVGWTLYGCAFFVLAKGVAPDSTGPLVSYIAAFTASYILGYVILFAPGGLGVRDASVAAFLGQLQLTTGGAGVVIAVASRLWLTVLEVIPGLAYLALGAVPRGKTIDGRR